MPDDSRIPRVTLRSLARSFLSEGQAYGFQLDDYLDFASILLEVVMEAAERGELPTVSAELPLRSARVHIRSVEPGDRPVLEGWLSDAAGRLFLLSLHDQPLALDALLHDPAHAVGLVTLPDGTPVGATAFLHHDRAHGTAELRKLVGDPAMRGRGLGSEATRLWLAYGIRSLALERIHVHTLATNQHNIRLNEQLGFRVEGVLRDQVVVDGEPHHLLRMGLTVSRS